MIVSYGTCATPGTVEVAVPDASATCATGTDPDEKDWEDNGSASTFTIRSTFVLPSGTTTGTLWLPSSIVRSSSRSSVQVSITLDAVVVVTLDSSKSFGVFATSIRIF